MKIRSFENTEALILETLNLLRATLPTPGNLMLSGGSTPYVIYNRLAAAPCPVHAERRLFLSDERMQPFDSDLNNARNLEPMLESLHCADRFIRVNTALPRAEAAEQFAADLQPLEKVDLGFLGMGGDGHTAGFFTPEQARIQDRLTLHTDRPDGLEGVSVTPAFFQRLEKIILLVTGESKRDIINTLRRNPQSIAAGIALSGHPNCELWTDIRLD
ncbi:6-phosphogluconolactonase [Pontiella sp.]|uniref:6-phosphogluconolactonase n=1 Tax=Pontiella sp. TaxID=2837462 RepID=UPI00356882B9